VVTAFLNPKIDNENIYMELPARIDWVDKRTPKGAKVHLLKSLYGLKQSLRLWYQAINAFLLSLDLKQSSANPNLYVKDRVLLLLYVDDILIVSMSDNSSRSPADEVITALKNKYKISDLGEARHFLGLDINRNEDGISLSQGSYIDTLLKWFALPRWLPNVCRIRISPRYILRGQLTYQIQLRTPGHTFNSRQTSSKVPKVNLGVPTSLPLL
jgi:hypothetical protein